ncbi:MAG: hypothetical protein JO040_00260, partial [Gemmatimonadetes bacterium]|nr:hypothetical protein [Gemmatimonadota bacterium]
KLVEMIAGRSVAEAVQRTIQYTPDPPTHVTLPDADSCPLDPPAPAHRHPARHVPA